MDIKTNEHHYICLWSETVEIKKAKDDKYLSHMTYAPCYWEKYYDLLSI